MTWKKLSSTTLLQHPRMTIMEDGIQLPDGHVTKYIYQAEAKDSVTAIALHKGSLIIQKEYSYPPNQTLYQFPGGGIKDGEGAGSRSTQRAQRRVRVYRRQHILDFTLGIIAEATQKCTLSL